MIESERDQLLKDGVQESVLLEIESLYPCSEFAHRINWFEHDVPTLKLACPVCGSEMAYELDAINDFFCPEDEECGYDYADPSESRKPLLA